MPLNQPLQQKKPNTTGTGYTNIQRILQANKANKLGATVGSGVQQAGQAARGAIGVAGQQFNAGVDAEKNRLGQESERANRILGDVTKATDEDVNAFEGIRGGLTKGPNTISNADELRQQAQEAENLGNAGGSEAGRYGLLQRFIGGNKQYTGGQQRVDSLLLGQTGAKDLRAAKKDTVGLTEQTDSKIQAASELGKELQGRAKNLADTTISGLSNKVVDYDKAMEAARIKAEADLSDRQKSDIEQLKSGVITDEDLYEALGIKEGSRLYNTDLSQFYQGLSNNLATKQNVQTEADFNKMEALRRLSGNSLTGEASALMPAYTDKSQVDQFKTNKDYRFDQDALKGAIDTNRMGALQGNVGAMAHIQESLRHLYGTNISDEQHEQQLQDYGTSARENNFQRQLWSGGGYGDTALYWDRPDPGTAFWERMLDSYTNSTHYLRDAPTFKTNFNKTLGTTPVVTDPEDENA